MVATSGIILRLGLAAVLGGVVGIERERLEGAAGLRTHMLVCVGSALMMIVSANGFADVLGSPHVVLDPSRIAAQVVSGIGFLGAGTILLSRGQVIRGLTTAASLWTVAGVGLAVGVGLFLAAACATTLTILIRRGGGGFAAIESTVHAVGATVGNITLQRESSDLDEVRIQLSRRLESGQPVHPLENLRAINGVRQVDF